MLDRLGRDLRHLVNLADDLTKRGIGLKLLAGEGTSIDTITVNSRRVFARLAEFERADRRADQARLAVARAQRWLHVQDDAPKLRLAQAARVKLETKVTELCVELGITRQTLYRFVGPKGELSSDGQLLLYRRKVK